VSELASQAGQAGTDVPLFVDMDGVLVHTDTTAEGAFALIRKNPAYALALPWWLLNGRANFKRQVALRVDIDPEKLPYNHDFINFLKTEKASGRRLILATAADVAYGERVAAHLGLFDAVLGSDGTVDLAGSRKLEGIRDFVGNAPFDYAGNHLSDFKVFAHTRKAIVVNPEPAVRRAAGRETKIDRIFDDGLQTYGDYLLALHPRRWLMNLLVLLPILVAAEPADPWIWLQAVVAAVAFCLFASSLYLFDDFLHLPQRRMLPADAHSPVVAGRVLADRVAPMIPVLFVAGCVIAAVLSGGVLAMLGLFLFVWVLGSMTAAHAATAGILASALLAAIRVLAGGVAISSPAPVWLLGIGLLVGAVVELARARKLGFV
jgi:hypothetical protein